MAIYMYVQALSFRPRDFNTLCKLGSIEEKRDEPELATRAFELAAEAKPDDPLITGHLGLLYLQQNDEDKALGWLEPERCCTAARTGMYSMDSGSRRAITAKSRAGLQHLQQAVALAPAEPRLRCTAGNCCSTAAITLTPRRRCGPRPNAASCPRRSASWDRYRRSTGNIRKPSTACCGRLTRPLPMTQSRSSPCRTATTRWPSVTSSWRRECLRCTTPKRIGTPRWP